MASFEEANEIQKRLDSDGDELYGLRGTLWADLLVRVGRLTRAKELTQANLRICHEYRWSPSEARCHQYLGRVDTLEGRESSAMDHLRQAEKIFRNGHMLLELASLLLFQADLLRRCKDWDKALRCIEEALRLAMPRRLALIHADALVLRGRIRLDRRNAEQVTDPEQAEKVIDDARDGLGLAQQCGYAWAERDAQALLVDAHDALGRTDETRGHRREAKLLTNALQL